MTGLWTIDYEKAAWPDALAALRTAGIARVIDVRQFPLSRRAGFSKRQLAAGLAEAGLALRQAADLAVLPQPDATGRPTPSASCR